MHQHKLIPGNAMLVSEEKKNKGSNKANQHKKSCSLLLLTGSSFSKEYIVGYCQKG